MNCREGLGENSCRSWYLRLGGDSLGSASSKCQVAFIQAHIRETTNLVQCSDFTIEKPREVRK